MKCGTTIREVSAMKELLTVVTRKGEMTVPAEIRTALNLKQGDKVAVTVPESNLEPVQLRRVGSVVERTAGMLHNDIPMLSPAEEKEAAAQAWADEATKRMGS